MLKSKYTCDMPHFKYYIFNTLNVREGSVRLQESRTNVAISQILIHKLIFQDHTLWFFDIGNSLW